MKQTKSSESSESKLHESDGDISKNEQKLLRKSIINIATKSDINIAGFTKDFLDSLDEKNKKYIKSLSELKIKIMRSEISKKYK